MTAPAEVTPTAPVSPAAPDPQTPAAPVSAAVVKPVPDALKPAEPAPKPDSAKATPAPDASKPTDPNAKPDPIPPVVPEKYELKAPEGMEIDAQLVEAVTPVFKKHGLSQEAAQEIADIHAAHVKTAKEAQDQAFKAMTESWKQETIKALGAEHVEQLAFAAKTRDRFLSKETNELLESTGLGNHPKVVSDFINLGKAISEGRLVDGARGPQGATPQTLFPSMQNP